MPVVSSMWEVEAGRLLAPRNWDQPGQHRRALCLSNYRIAQTRIGSRCHQKPDTLSIWPIKKVRSLLPSLSCTWPEAPQMKLWGGRSTAHGFILFCFCTWPSTAVFWRYNFHLRCCAHRATSCLLNDYVVMVFLFFRCCGIRKLAIKERCPKRTGITIWSQSWYVELKEREEASNCLGHERKG